MIRALESPSLPLPGSFSLYNPCLVGTMSKEDDQGLERIIAESRVGEKVGEMPALVSAMPAEK